MTTTLSPSDAGAVVGEAPLSGVTVIDLSHVYNGPYATFLMALAGAEVIKVEPHTGEHLRSRGDMGGGRPALRHAEFEQKADNA